MLSAILFRCGGTDQWKWCPIKQKLWRAFIGFPVGIWYAISLHTWLPLLCLLTYFWQPPYGEKSYLNFLGENWKFAVCGFVFGISSGPVWIAKGMLGMAILQGCIGAVGYYVLHILDDKNIVKNPWQEILRGTSGTITFLIT